MAQWKSGIIYSLFQIQSSSLKALIKRWSLDFIQLREVRGGVLKSRGPNFSL